ncbi:APC family permease [Litorimonas sp. WD9-15]|uniref:APC family permease n=1 Tax=Litorimonas sp. WD9-15 TaxID=3418716 RepID=UPI003D056979
MSDALKRTVGLPGAVLLGLGSILGTGAFVGLGFAVGISATLAPIALLFAGLLAGCNAMSSAQLAAAHPVSGGTYAYGYKYLSPTAGFTAGTCFLLAKSASAAAAGLGLAAYLLPQIGLGALQNNIVGAGLILLITAFVALGLRRANLLNTVLVTFTLVALIWLCISATLTIEPPRDASSRPVSPPAFLESIALLFVAFTGYGRIATLGEEVTDPRRTIPKAILATIFISTALYFALMLSGLNVLGAAGFADATRDTEAPLRAVADELKRSPLILAVSIAAGTAMAGVALNLLLGLSRVVLAMGRQGDLPKLLAQLNKSSEPVRAVWLVGIAIALIALFGGLKLVWSFSAFTVLVYYSLTNLSALRLPKEDRLYPRLFSWLGLFGCAGLSVFVDWRVIVLGSALILVALGLRAILSNRGTT